MRVLAISEHFHPRVGGTAEYVARICETLHDLGHEVHLLVPGSGDAPETVSGHPYKVTALGVGWRMSGQPERKIRYRFCDEVQKFVARAVAEKRFEVVHLLYGLFVTEVLDTASVKEKGVAVVTTLHSVPPTECARSWTGDGWLARFKDRLRLRAVAWKNRRRLRRHAYDRWIVPSAFTGRDLSRHRPDARLEVIGHGCSEHLLEASPVPERRAPNAGGTLQLLTVGGFAPHKRQHLVPAVATTLSHAGIDFQWKLIGPPGRIARYHDAICADIDRRGLAHRVHVRGTVSFEELANLYAEAHLYVQPSTEEGFCMTALDAAALGLPVIASPSGALPEICRLSEGVLVPSEIDDIAKAIGHYLAADLWPDDALAAAKQVRRKFNWQKTATKLVGIYQSLLDQSN